jgi:hypothetical protein
VEDSNSFFSRSRQCDFRVRMVRSPTGCCERSRKRSVIRCARGTAVAPSQRKQEESVAEQLFGLMVLALPVACLSWTFTREEILREPREWLVERSRKARHWWQRKFLFMWTCDYCLSHYVAAGVVAIADFTLLLPDWRGYGIAWLALVSVANVYMSAYSRLRVEIRKEKMELEEVQSRSRRAG